ncbi:MAG: putative methionine-R-sulfoxide reductase with GAF domain [Cognaticolwellia sp.]|jgi:putative methionine-R-sulfoxide reductase with GAF domain
MLGFEKKTPSNHDTNSHIAIKNTSSNSMVIPFNEGVIGKVAATKQAILVKDIRKFKGYIVEDETTLLELAVLFYLKSNY